MPSACLAAVRNACSFRREYPRESACSAVPCESPLVHGGAPPSKWKKYSHAMPPARLRGERDRFFEHFAQRFVVVPVVVVAVGLAEGRQPLDLDALPWVVLPHQAAARHAHVLVGGGQRLVAPPLDVAFEREHQPRGAARGSAARRRRSAARWRSRFPVRRGGCRSGAWRRSRRRCTPWSLGRRFRRSARRCGSGSVARRTPWGRALRGRWFGSNGQLTGPACRPFGEWRLWPEVRRQIAG